MTKNQFAPKGEDEIRQEVLEDLGIEEVDDENKEIIDKLTARRLKDEEFKASLHKSKIKYKELALNGKKDEKKEEPKAQKSDKSVDLIIEEKLFAKEHGQTALHNLKKVMRGTGKTFDEAKKDTTFIAFMAGREQDAKRRGAQLGGSKIGGSGTASITEDQRKMAIAMGNNPEDVYK